MPRRKNIKGPGRCLFCGDGAVPGNPMSKEHIWSDWLRQILPKGSGRMEGMTQNRLDEINGQTIRYRQGDVGTKKVRVVCRNCNNSWMSEIVERAKPFARRLINGERITLDVIAQRAMTNWIALSALMANQITRSRHKLPRSDIDQFFNAHAAPPHWFVGIGYIYGSKAINFSHAYHAIVMRDKKTGKEQIDFIKHSFATILGDLYTLVDANVYDSINHPLAAIQARDIYAPNLIGIQPFTSSVIPFPPLLFYRISGPSLFLPGTAALSLARRFVDFLDVTVRVAGSAPKYPT